ncbi:hypothetical protein I316_00608 [Kwoniella heveanensis BCC8398]|uniref:Uncharacterized protein n=1 Tax=Kwoniella heveanensis BCC8398 TaxID=1296120 RepID=A0A1B9H2H5_9TREE|nr:hypothetical protein I316_00608 [Kwoniella heveanensis BCC8398]
MKRQRQLLKYWKNLEDYDQAIIISREAYSNEISGKADAEEAKRKKKRAGAWSKRSKAYRMTRMIFGYDYDDNVDDHGRYLVDRGGERTSGGDGLRRRGTITVLIQGRSGGAR